MVSVFVVVDTVFLFCFLREVFMFLKGDEREYITIFMKFTTKARYAVNFFYVTINFGNYIIRSRPASFINIW